MPNVEQAKQIMEKYGITCEFLSIVDGSISSSAVYSWLAGRKLDSGREERLLTILRRLAGHAAKVEYPVSFARQWGLWWKVCLRREDRDGEEYDTRKVLTPEPQISALAGQ